VLLSNSGTQLSFADAAVVIIGAEVRARQPLNVLSKLYYRYKKILKTIRLYLIIAGPNIIVMVADNDAGGITSYTATGAQYGFHLIWFRVLLGRSRTTCRK
jgi:hypothetical protein